MTLQELYESIGGDYSQVMRILRMEKLVDKHIRKFSQNGVVERLLEAGQRKDSTELFEASHAMKGICGNLGLKALCDLASEISEEFRPGNARRMSDEEVDQKIEEIAASYQKVKEGILQYAEALQ